MLRLGRYLSLGVLGASCLVAWAGVGCSSESSTSGECSRDAHCSGDRVCENSRCVAPDEGAGGSGSGAEGGTSAGGEGGTSAGGEGGTPAGGEGGSPGTAGMPGMCADVGAACETNGECCGFTTDASSETICLTDTNSCEPTCQTNEDCDTGCCGALQGIEDYGYCAPIVVCDPCLRGIVYACVCFAEADPESACTESEIEDFVATCADPTNTLAQAFTCLGERGEPADLNACAASFEACPIEAGPTPPGG